MRRTYRQMDWWTNQARRGRLLELDLDAAAGRVCEDLLGVVVEPVTPYAVSGRCGRMGW